MVVKEFRYNFAIQIRDKVENVKFEMIAKTFQGLEEVLAKELINLGADDVELLRRGVKFSGDLAMMYKANLCCHTALRILKPIYKFEASDADEVYDKIKAFDWSKMMDCSKTFAVDSVVFSENFKHSKFLSYRVKDAIADYFNEREGKRPSVRLVNPDIQLSIHIAQDKCTLCLDSTGEPLSKRGYREVQTEAPINEVLAAGMLMLAGWDGSTDLIDPMCGSGTILIEAALIAKNIAPGIYRKNGFAFEKWPDFDQDLFDDIFNDDTHEREFEHHIYGSDISPKAADIALANVKRAGMAKCIDVRCLPFQQLERPTEKSLLIFNPPYGERLAADFELYRMIGTKLKSDFTDMEAWIIAPLTEASEKIGLRPSLKHKLFNGAIECEFRKYEMFQGRRNDFIRSLAEKEESEKENAEPEKKQYVRPDSYIDRGFNPVSEEDEYSYRSRRHIAFEKSQHEAAGEYFDKETGEWKKKKPRREFLEKGEYHERGERRERGDFHSQRKRDERHSQHNRYSERRDSKSFRRDRDGSKFRKGERSFDRSVAHRRRDYDIDYTAE